jgi:hypothetical protein
MDPLKRFGEGWQPRVIGEERLAEGTWWYEGLVPYSIVLKRQRLNYTAEDVARFGGFIHMLDWNHPVHPLTPEGVTYLWAFAGPTGQTQSPYFTGVDDAAQHLQTYVGRTEIRWLRVDGTTATAVTGDQ